MANQKVTFTPEQLDALEDVLSYYAMASQAMDHRYDYASDPDEEREAIAHREAVNSIIEKVEAARRKAER